MCNDRQCAGNMIKPKMVSQTSYRLSRPRIVSPKIRMVTHAVSSPAAPSPVAVYAIHYTGRGEIGYGAFGIINLSGIGFTPRAFHSRWIWPATAHRRKKSNCFILAISNITLVWCIAEHGFQAVECFQDFLSYRKPGCRGFPAMDGF